MLSQAKCDRVLYFLSDANSFVASSREAIERSAPHIYLSALPFVARDSLIHRMFIPLFGGLISVQTFGINGHGDRLIMTLNGHNQMVISIAYSPDGRLLASGSDTGTVSIWDTRTGEETVAPLLSDGSSVNSLAFSPNGESIASGTNVGVYIWTGITSQPTTLRLTGHSKRVSCVAFSPNGSVLASGSWDKTIRLWSADTGKNVAILRGHTGEVTAVAFHPSGQTLASCSGDRTIRLWTFQTGEHINLPIWYDRDRIECIHFSPDGRFLASSSFLSSDVKIWNIQTWSILATLRGHVGWVGSVQFSPDGQSLVSASQDKSACLWKVELTTGRYCRTVLSGHSQSVTSAVFSPDGQCVASASLDGTIRIWNAGNNQRTVQPLPAHAKAVNSVAVSPDGSLIVSGSYDHSVRVWDMRTGVLKLHPLLGHTDEVLSVSISSDGRLIASASADLTIRLWYLHTGGASCEPLKGHESLVSAVAFSPDAMSLASGSSDKTVRMWDVAAGKPLIFSPLMFDDEVDTVTFSPDGQLLAAGGLTEHIHIWQIASGQLLRRLPIGGHYGKSIQFSPAGTHILSAGSNGVFILGLTTAERIPVHGSVINPVNVAAFSPDGRIVCMIFQELTVILWNLATRSTIAVLHGHRGRVPSVAFTPCGQSIVSCAHNGTIRVWDIMTACWQQSNGSGDLVTRLTSSGLKDGWLLGPAGELLLWVPEEYRAYLHVPPCTTLIGARCIFVDVGANGLYHGENWTKCWRNDTGTAVISHSM